MAARSKLSECSRIGIPALLIFLLVAGLSLQSESGQAQNRTIRRRATRARKSPRRTVSRRSGGKTQSSGELALGTWGGEHIHLISSGEGTRIELDCAHATIKPQIRLNQSNCFVVQGSYFREHAGPSRPGEMDQSEPVRFQGCVKGDTLELTIALNGTSGTDTFTLVSGRAGQITKCL